MIRRWVLRIFVLAILLFALSRLTEFKTTIRVLRYGQWQWIVGALLLQFIAYAVRAKLYQMGLAATGIPSRFRDIIPITFASTFVNTAAPTQGAAGISLFVDDARRRGQSPARATMGALMILVADYGALCLIVLVGLIFLFIFHDLQWYEVTAAVLLYLFVGGMAIVLAFGLWQPAWLHDVLVWVQAAVNLLGGWFRYPALLAENWNAHNADEFSETARAIAARPLILTRTLAIAASAHVVDVASLYCLFLAFGQSVYPGVLIAGYAMTALFWIVSPTPNGVGIVEGLMPIIYVSLGVPAVSAIVISLAFRGLSFWLPLFIGYVLLRRLDTFSGSERSIAESESVHMAAVATAVMGVINLLSGATPALRSRTALLADYSPLAIRHGGHLASVLSGFALLLLARELWRRKRTAWLLTLGVLMLSMAAHLVKGLDYEEALLAAILAGFLWTQRAHFQALSDPPSIWQGVRVLAVALLFTLSYGSIGFYLLDRHFSVKFNLQAAITQTIVMFTEFYDPGLQPLTGFGRYFGTSIYLVGAITLGYGLWKVLRPVLVRSPAGPAERSRAARIIDRYGRTALARFALFPDKSYFFSPGGSVVAYAAKGHNAIALGDPIGPTEDTLNAITGFCDFCIRNAWQSAFYQALPDYLDDYRQAGFDIVCIGHEAIVDLTTFTVSGASNKTRRWTLNHLSKLGYSVQLHEPPIPDALLDELGVVSDEWLASINGTEQHFSFGWFDDDYVRSSLVVAVHSSDGSIVAFANLITGYPADQLTIDLMRYRRESVPDVMDFLFISLFILVKEKGYAAVNLGLSALSGVGESPEDAIVEKALHHIYEHVNQFYNFKGLHAFKSKFHPIWSPRYLVFPGAGSLLGVAWTLGRISSGNASILDYINDLQQQWRERKAQQARPEPTTDRSQTVLSAKAQPGAPVLPIQSRSESETMKETSHEQY